MYRFKLQVLPNNSDRQMVENNNQVLPNNDRQLAKNRQMANTIKTLLEEIFNKPPMMLNDLDHLAIKFLNKGGLELLRRKEFAGNHMLSFVTLKEKNKKSPPLKIIMYHEAEVTVSLYVEIMKLSLKDMAALEISKRVKEKDVEKLYGEIPRNMVLEVKKNYENAKE